MKRFESHLTSQEARRRCFQLNITHKNVGIAPGTEGPLILAGLNALTVKAEPEELRRAQLGIITNPYEAV